MNKIITAIVASAMLTLISCGNKEAASPAWINAEMDTTVSPGDDFYQFANGTFLKNLVIPEDQSRWGAFGILDQENQKKLIGILDETAKTSGAKGSEGQLLGDFHASYMDTATIEKKGIEPLKPFFKEVDAVKDYKELLMLMAKNYKYPFPSYLAFGIMPDDKNPEVNTMGFYQNGLSLPEKEMYSSKEPNIVKMVEGVTKNKETFLNLAGYSPQDAAKYAKEIMAFEKSLSTISLSNVEMRDVVKNYHKMSIQDFQKLITSIDVVAYLNTLGLKTDSVIVYSINFYQNIDNILAKTDINVLKANYKLNMTSAMAPYMSKALVQASFESGKIFSGSPTDKPRWKKAVRVATENLDHLISKKYVEKFYPKEAKDKMDEMINNIQVSMESHIKGLTWMGNATKQKALQKLGTIMKKIGFPSQWREYKGLEIKKDDLFGNILAATKHENERRFKELNRPVDKQEWGMPASIVNAYYNPSFNEIVFPAGILQFPFFDYKADDALNYGAIGLVIGHEITHGFDDQGCHYDHVGKMADWWTPEDAKQFEAKTAKLVSLYDNCVGVDNMHVKGALTLGENIADFGGLAISYDAFKMTKQSKENKSIDGFTPDQRFFLGFARCWRNKARKEQEITQLQSDPHSPPKYRVLMPLANFDAFYTAFNVKPTNKMYIKPEDRVKVW